MANPTKYTPSYSYSGWQASNPSKPLPAPRVDDDFANISRSVNETIDALKGVLRSDGRLMNGIVGADAISSTLKIGFTFRGLWQQGKSYAAGDGVVHEGVFYSAAQANIATEQNEPGDTTYWTKLFSVDDLVVEGALSMPVNRFTGDGALTEFDLDFTPVTAKNLLITIGGAPQETTQYVTSGNKVIFSEPPPEGYSIEVRGFATLAVSDTVVSDTIIEGETNLFQTPSEKAKLTALPDNTALNIKLSQKQPLFDSPADAATFDLSLFSTIVVNRSAPFRKIKPHRYSLVVQPANVEPPLGPKFMSADGKWWALDEDTVRPEFFGIVGVQNDTAAIQGAIDYASTVGCCIDLQGVWFVTKVTISLGNSFFQVTGNAEIIAIDTSPQTCLVEINRGNFSMTGSMAAVCSHRTNYACGFWIWHPTQLQTTIFDKLIAAYCLVGAKLGHPDYPSAVISENPFEGIRTFGCPEGLHIIGLQTYALVNNPPMLSGDHFGGDAAWRARPKRAIVNVGSNTVLTGGEVLQNLSSAPTDCAVEMRPIKAGAELSWGRVKILGSFIETAGPLCLINNPEGLTGLNSAKDRGRVIFSFIDGYVDGNTAPFVKVANGSGFTGDIILDFPNFWHPGTRTFANIDCGDNACHVYCRGGNFGGGFLPMLAGVVGGILHYEHQIIFQGFGLPTSNLALGGNLLKFQSSVAGGNLARWQSMYSSATGAVTIPLGGKDAIRLESFIHVAGATGQLIVKRNGVQVQASPVSTGDFTVAYSEKDPPVGTVYTFELVISSFVGGAPVPPSTNAGPNTFVLWASR